MNNYRKYFNKSILEKYPNSSEALLDRINSNYLEISKDTEFAKSSGNPMDRRLDFSAYFLALIKSLDENGETFETIRLISLEVVNDYVKPKNRLHAFSKRLIPKLIDTWIGRILIKYLKKKVKGENNSEGFVVDIITDKEETYGFGYGIDILECGICKLFKKHNYYKYASILCEVDEITSSLAGLKLIRNGTIANGAKKCDFRFQRVK